MATKIMLTETLGFSLWKEKLQKNAGPGGTKSWASMDEGWSEASDVDSFQEGAFPLWAPVHEPGRGKLIRIS